MSMILDKLLKGQNIEWEFIGDVCNVITDFTAAGSFASNAENVRYLQDENYAQLIRTTDLKSKFENDKNFVYVDEKAFKYLWRVNLHKESIVLPNVGNCGEVYYLNPQDLPYKNNVLGPNALLLRSESENNKYLYYIFHSKEFQNNLRKITSSTGQSKFNKTNLKTISIPIPSLEVQAEIVRILDAFTALTAELTAELNMRKKQYHYYRDNLLTFSDDEVEWKTLGETGTLIRGNGMQKKDFTETGFPAIHYGQIYTHFGTFANTTKSYVSDELAKKLRKAHKGDVLLAGTSENIQDVMKPLGWLGDEVAISGDMFAYRPNNDLDTKYLTYLLQTTEFQKYKEKYAQGAKVTRINSAKFLNFKIPIPSLNEQKRIANILDNFETYTNSITEGLPKEIALRQKQYEYYREQLLDFPK